MPHGAEGGPKKSFQYEWELVSSPRSDLATAQELSGLTHGVYIWRVAVTSVDPPGYGEIMLPPKRIDYTAKAVVQTVTLRTDKAVMDVRANSTGWFI